MSTLYRVNPSIQKRVPLPGRTLERIEEDLSRGRKARARRRSDYTAVFEGEELKSQLPVDVIDQIEAMISAEAFFR